LKENDATVFNPEKCGYQTPVESVYFSKTVLQK